MSTEPEAPSALVQIDPTPLIGISVPLGRKRFAKERRVFFGATVATATANQVVRWKGAGKRKLSAGLVTDQVVRHAKKTGFRPVRKSP